MDKRYPWGTFTLCWLTGMSAGMNAHLFSVLVSPIMNALGQTVDSGAFVLSSFLVGWAIGGIVIGTASDRIGRVRAMAFAIATFCLFSVMSAFVGTITQLAACRFAIGLGVGGAMVNMSLLLAEHWPAHTKALAVGSLLTSYQAGVFASGMLVYLVPDWRIAFAAGASPIVLVPLILLGIKEKLLVRVAVDAPQDKRSVIVGSVLFGSLLVAYWASASWIPTWIQNLAGSDSGSEKSTATMLHGIAAILGCFAAGPLVNLLGRIRTVVGAFILALIFTVSTVFLHETFSLSVYVSYALLGIAVGIAQAALYIFLPEMFPAHARGRDVGICLNGGRIFTAVAVLLGTFIVPMLGGYAHGIVFFAMAYCIGIGAALMGSETAQKLAT